MESPSRFFVAGLKRKQTECCGVGPCKVARVGTEHGTSPHSCAHSCPMQPTIAESCLNYFNSGLPRRILFYYQDEWLDFSEPVVQILTTAFKDEKSSVTFSASGQLLLFDFLSMVLINLQTRKHWSIAWIDEFEKCFFPTFFFDDEADKYPRWVLAIAAQKPQGTEVVRACDSPPEVVKRVVVENGASVSQRLFAPEILLTKIEKLERDNENFRFVHKLFLSGMGPFATSKNILQVLKCVQKDNTAQMRLSLFESQIKTTREERGDANVQYGWFGSSKTNIVGILIHGFGNAGKPTQRAAFGTGIYLTPENRAFASVNLSDVDEKGMQHMMLCRIVLGNMEQVKPRSKQYLPSSQDFDSGVDNILCPKCFVTWPTHTHSYIHPEYIVTFKLTPDVRDYLFGLKDVRFNVPLTKVGLECSAFRPVRCQTVKAPNSPWLSFTTLFGAIQDSISPLAKELLYHHYDEMRRKILTREGFVKKMKLIIGDLVLVSTLQRHQRSPASWFDGSDVQKTDTDDCASSIAGTNETTAQKMESNKSFAMKPSCSALPTLELNDSKEMLSGLTESATN